MALNKELAAKGRAAIAADKTKQGRPLTAYERDYILQLTVLGDNRRTIQQKFLEKYGRTLNERTVTRLRAENRLKLDEAKNSIINQGMTLVSGDALKQKAYSLINHKLRHAEDDESEIEKIRIKFKAGEITKHEYDVQVARYERLTVNELVKIAEMGFEHAHKGNESGALTPEDQAALTLLTEGLKNGNPMQLIQVLNPNFHVTPNA